MPRGNLLIVDDEALITKMLKLTLAEYADHIHVTTNGKEALAVLENNEVHCIICDINMPVMNGVEFIKEVRNRNIQIPFIFYTGLSERELMLEAVKYGAFDFLNKPNLEGLEEVVSRGLREGFQRPETTDAESQMSEYQKLLRELG